MDKKNLKFGKLGLYSLYKQQFEVVFLRFFKKLIRRKYYKAKMRFLKPKFWFFLNINFIYSAKSKNARMGAGIGSYVRLTSLLNPKYSVLECISYSKYYLKKILSYLEFKCSINLWFYEEVLWLVH